MEHKIFEVLDSSTCMVIMGFIIKPRFFRNLDTDPNHFIEGIKEVALLSRAGYGIDEMLNNGYIGLITLDSGNFSGSSDPYGHRGSRTLITAHDYIIKNWGTLKSGDVIDVEFILGETKVARKSDILGETYDRT